MQSTHLFIRFPAFLAQDYGKGPNPQLIYRKSGYEYLAREFPELDYITGCVIIPDDGVREDLSVTKQSYRDLAERLFDDEEAEVLEREAGARALQVLHQPPRRRHQDVHRRRGG